MNADRDEGSTDGPDRSADAGRSGSDGGYVYRPGTDAEGTVSEQNGGSTDGFGARGWVLVGVVVVSFLVIPALIYLRPAELADAGFPFVVAMLVLPMVPAVLLGLTAVWSMTGGAGSSSDESDGSRQDGRN